MIFYFIIFIVTFFIGGFIISNWTTHKIFKNENNNKALSKLLLNDLLNYGLNKYDFNELKIEHVAVENLIKLECPLSNIKMNKEIVNAALVNNMKSIIRIEASKNSKKLQYFQKLCETLTAKNTIK